MDIIANWAWRLCGGAPRLGKYHNMRTAIVADDWRLAAAEALDSKWARQLPARAAEIAGLLRG